MMRNTSHEIHAAYRLIAEHVYGRLGVFAYEAFDFISRQKPSGWQRITSLSSEAQMTVFGDG